MPRHARSLKKSRLVKSEIRLNQILTNEYTKLNIGLGMNSNYTQNDKNRNRLNIQKRLTEISPKSILIRKILLMHKFIYIIY